LYHIKISRHSNTQGQIIISASPKRNLEDGEAEELIGILNMLLKRYQEEVTPKTTYEEFRDSSPENAQLLKEAEEALAREEEKYTLAREEEKYMRTKLRTLAKAILRSSAAEKYVDDFIWEYQVIPLIFTKDDVRKRVQ
jgi:hypothetical protein